MTLLVHPVTEARIDVRPQAVDTWRRSGWTAPEDLAAGGPAADQNTGSSTESPQE